MVCFWSESQTELTTVSWLLLLSWIPVRSKVLVNCTAITCYAWMRRECEPSLLRVARCLHSLHTPGLCIGFQSSLGFPLLLHQHGQGLSPEPALFNCIWYDCKQEQKHAGTGFTIATIIVMYVHCEEKRDRDSFLSHSPARGIPYFHWTTGMVRVWSYAPVGQWNGVLGKLCRERALTCCVHWMVSTCSPKNIPLNMKLPQSIAGLYNMKSLSTGEDVFSVWGDVW